MATSGLSIAALQKFDATYRPNGCLEIDTGPQCTVESTPAMAEKQTFMTTWLTAYNGSKPAVDARLAIHLQPLRPRHQPTYTLSATHSHGEPGPRPR